MGKITSYPPDTAPTTDDLVITVDSGSGSNRKVSVSDLIATIITNFSVSQIMTMLSGITSLAHNLLINGNFDVWTRNTTFTQNDDLYTADRWNGLQEANSAWTFSRDTDVPTTNSKYSMKGVNVTLNNQAGMVYFMEGKDAAQLLNQNVSLSFWAKTTSLQISNLRCAILSWTGTEDVLTSDVVGTWAQNGTNPTWAASYTMENTPANLALTNSWQQFKIENVPIDTAGMKNVAVVIWVDDGTITAADTFWLAQAQMNVGIKALPIQLRPYGAERALCQRYFCTSYPDGTVAGTADGYTQQQAQFIADTTSDTHSTCRFPVDMRITPTLTQYAFDGATGSGTAANVRDNTAGGLRAVGSVTLNRVGISNFTCSGLLTAGRAYGFNYAADAEL